MLNMGNADRTTSEKNIKVNIWLAGVALCGGKKDRVITHIILVVDLDMSRSLPTILTGHEIWKTSSKYLIIPFKMSHSYVY